MDQALSKPFEVCWERVERAEAHREAMATLWNGFVDNHPYDVKVNVHSDGTGDISIMRIADIPSGIALELGEYLYQMRAALDASIYETACKNTGQRPPPNERVLEFPVCRTQEQFQKSRGKIASLTEEQRSIVESVQPYNAPDDLADDLQIFSLNRSIGILHDWARKDRHRKLHVVATWASNIDPQVRLVGSDLGPIQIAVERRALLLNEYCKVATFSVQGWSSDMKVEANPNVLLDIAIDEVPMPCSDTDWLDNRLRSIMIAVGSIVHSLGKTVGVDRV